MQAWRLSLPEKAPPFQDPKWRIRRKIDLRVLATDFEPANDLTHI